MKRKDFLKSCAAGMCSCAAFGLAVPDAAEAQQASGAPENPEVAGLKRRLDAAQSRFAALVAVLARELDAPSRKKILGSLGGACADQYNDMIAKYENNIRGFLAYAREEWVDEAVYDEKAGTIRLVDKSSKCACPLVKQGTTPGAFCDCTLGWQAAVYSRIIGRPVEVELERSILRGDQHCAYLVRII
jgi:hypothetical protein